MGRYLAKRLPDLFLTVLGVTTVVFFVARLTGDPVRLMVGIDANEAEINRMRDLLGLNDPLYVQYFRFLGDVLHGDFGNSLRYHVPATQLVFEAIPYTLILTFAALGLSVLVSVPTGIISALKRNTGWDTVVSIMALLGQCMPVFWLGILLMLLFAVQLGWFPTSGSSSWKNLVLPAVALSGYSMARISRLVRAGMLEVMSQEYVRTARAKGLREAVVIWRHAMKNAAIPVVTVIGLEFGAMLGGAVVTETIFAWPGMGRAAVSAIYAYDFPVVQATVFYAALIFVTINMLVDMTYTLLDPRVRLE